MLKVDYHQDFLKKIRKIKDQSLKQRIKKQIHKIVENPEIGKPMRYTRKGTRELYVSPFRIAYSYRQNELLLMFLDLYHKDQQ